MRSSAGSVDGKLRVICGPTAAGKSALVLALAERVDLMVLSADSRQIYRGFDIGTAKPSPAEREAVPHRGVDLVDPSERWSAAAWAGAAEGWTAEARALGRTPVVVGGTGFYIRALTAPLFEEPPLDPIRRARLAAELAPLRTGDLRARVEQLDPPRAGLGRAQLLRAIEIALLTGVPLSEWHRRAARPARVAARYLVVDPGERLAERMTGRARAMLRAGWAGEVEALMTWVPEGAPAWNGTGYRAVRDRVRGAIGEPEMLERVIRDSRHYAKRQRTWFRHQLPAAEVTMLDPTAPDAVERAATWWECAA